jgi:hypothetical protein
MTTSTKPPGEERFATDGGPVFGCLGWWIFNGVYIWGPQ